MSTLRAVGITFPTWFPASVHDDVCALSAQKGAPDRDAWKGCAAAWNAVAYRCRRADELAAALAHELDARSNSHPEGKFVEASALFEFAATAYSAAECCAFAIYCLLSLNDESRFPFNDASKLRRVSLTTLPAKVRQVRGEHSPLAASIESVTDRLVHLKEFRDFLSHRGHPPRKYFVGATAAPPASPWNPKSLPSEWDFLLELSGHSVDEWRENWQWGMMRLMALAEECAHEDPARAS